MNKEELQKTYQSIILKTNGGIDDYVVALCQIGNAISELDDQQHQLADLQHKLEVAEKALELACERVKYFEEMQDSEMGFEDFFGYESNYDLQGIIEQYKEQAEKEVKGE